MEVHEKVAIVTGGGSGIGRATALLLAARGARVVVADIDAAAAESTRQQIEQAHGQARAMRVDVAEAPELARLIDEVRRHDGRLDILHNNAGISGGPPPFPDGESARWRRLVDINFTAVVTGCQLGILAMRAQGGDGVIVNTASMGGFGPMPYNPIYAATKAGVIALTRSLAGAIEGTRIRVNCVCPGFVDTPMLRRGGDAATRRLAELPKLRAEDVAAAVLRLIEDDSINLKALQIGVNREPQLV